MMIQFNISRFGKLARWSLVNDKKYFVKSFLQVFAILTFLFLFFTWVMNRESVRSSINAYETCSIAVVFLFSTTVVIGSSFMFYSMEGKHDMQNLMMLPASNLEKYLMRYASWILLLPLYLVALLGADVLQYVVNLMVGHEHVTFVTSTLVDSLSRLFQLEVHSHLRFVFLNSLLSLSVWFHSLYALGATFFRTRKFNWVLTTLVIILLTILQAWAFSYEEHVSAAEATTTDLLITDLVALCWTILNFWLSYKLFCRQQVIGKFINW